MPRSAKHWAGRFILSLYLASLATSSAVGAEPGVTRDEARTLPQDELISRVLAQFQSTIVYVDRPRPGKHDDLRFATLPIPSNAGLCETQNIRVEFVDDEQAYASIKPGHSARVAISLAYHVIGGLDVKASSREGLLKDVAADEAACAADAAAVRRYFSAPDGQTAWVAARTVATIAARARDKTFSVECGKNPCGDIERSEIATVSPGQITLVRAEPCRSDHGDRLCFAVSVLNGPRREDGPGMVARDGWDFHAVVRDPMNNSDVVSFNEIVVENVSANQTSMEGPDQLIP
ncbi:MAG TPA: hypothetical protein VGL66_16115 [Caulobacteraceae bacterium]|jgi:hypothetical protein